MRLNLGIVPSHEKMIALTYSAAGRLKKPNHVAQPIDPVMRAIAATARTARPRGRPVRMNGYTVICVPGVHHAIHS